MWLLQTRFLEFDVLYFHNEGFGIRNKELNQ